MTTSFAGMSLFTSSEAGINSALGEVHRAQSLLRDSQRYPMFPFCLSKLVSTTAC